MDFPFPEQWAEGAIAALQGVAFVVFAYDKACAVAARSRVPNAWLRVLAACAGPGALLAMALFRHKIRYGSMVFLSAASCLVWVGWLAH